MKRKKPKSCKLTLDNSDNSDVEGQDSESNNFITFTIYIVSTNSSYESISEIPDSNGEAYNSYKNKDIQDIHNKLFEVQLTLKKQNMKFTKKIKSLLKYLEEVAKVGL